MNTDSNEFKPAKRRKKDGVDTRAERKRELDRIAQRATRERTKNKIADLEQRLASLESGDRNSEISRLTKTVAELRQENERYQTALVKMRFAINEALGETEGQLPGSVSPGSANGNRFQPARLSINRSNTTHSQWCVSCIRHRTSSSRFGCYHRIHPVAD